MHFWSDLGKIKFSPNWSDQMTWLMSQIITRHRDISNKISWAQFGAEEDLQKLTQIVLCIFPASFCTFWPVFGDWAFDKENEHQFENFKMFWKVDSIIFPTSYPMFNLDIKKEVKSWIEVVLHIQEVVLRVWARRCASRLGAAHLEISAVKNYTVLHIKLWHYAFLFGTVPWVAKTKKSLNFIKLPKNPLISQTSKCTPSTSSSKLQSKCLKEFTMPNVKPYFLPQWNSRNPNPLYFFHHVSLKP